MLIFNKVINIITNNTKKFITGVSIISILVSSSLVYAFDFSQINNINVQEYNPNIKYIGEKVKNIINKKGQNKYKRLQITMYLLDKLDQIKNKEKYKYLKSLLNQIENYLVINYLYKDLEIIPIKINYVVDGDTINFYNLINGKKYSLRMIGIDTPESNKKRFGYTECYGEEAKRHLIKLISLGKYFFVEKDKSQGDVGKYGRQLGYLLEIQRQRCIGLCGYKVINLNGQQVKDGYAWEYTYNKYHPYIYQSLFRQYQKYAENKKLGLWSPNTCDGKRKAINDVIKETANNLSDILDKNYSLNKQNNNLSCSNIKNIYCSRLRTCAEAKFYLNKCGLKRLDRDGDGVPCEKLCSK